MSEPDQGKPVTDPEDWDGGWSIMALGLAGFGVVTFLLVGPFIGVPCLLSGAVIFAAGKWGRRNAAWGLTLLIGGCLFVALSGLCTGYVVIATAIDAAGNVHRDLPASTVLTFALILGGIPFLIGIVMIGRARKPDGSRPAQKPPL